MDLLCVCSVLCSLCLWSCLFICHRRHCVVSLSKNIYPSLVLVQPRKTRPFITERLLMGRKESNQTNVYMCFVVTCWERADLLALVCGVQL